MSKMPKNLTNLRPPKVEPVPGTNPVRTSDPKPKDVTIVQWKSIRKTIQR